MKSEKVKEIKNNIIICSNKIECKGCSLFPNMKSTNCRNKLLADALTLINELESEKNSVLSRNTELLRKNESLKDRIAELEKVYDRQVRIINDLNIEVVKNQEKLPKFAKRLKDRLRYTSPTSDVLELSGLEFDGVEVEQCIDETLKEFTNEQKNIEIFNQ